MKLPENIKYYTDDGEIQMVPTSEMVKKIIKDFKVKDVGDKAASGVVKDVLSLNFRAKDEDVELPEGLEHLGDLNEYCSEIAKEHRKINEKEEQEERAVKELKAQEKALAKEAKEKEDKEYVVSQSKFEEIFTRKASVQIAKAEENVKAAMKGIKLPSAITMSGNGMGVILSENASKDDIATAAAAMIAATEGNRSMQGALQFVMGDLVNASVAKKIFRTKGEACKQVKFLIEDKLGRKLSGGGINANALMAERVPADKRILGKPPSLYYFASKVIAPKLKEGKPSDQIELDKKFDEERNNVIELVNDGTISSNADLAKHVAEFKKSCGLRADTPGDTRKAIERYLRRFFWASWIKENLVNENGVVRVRELGVDADAPAVEYTVGQITDFQQEAMNNLQNLLLAGYDVEKLIAGEEEVEVEVETEVEKDGKKKKVTTKEKKIVPVLMDDPFEDPSTTEEPKKEEPKKEEPKKEEPKEEEPKEEDVSSDVEKEEEE